jgi:hypothetical protein
VAIIPLGPGSHPDSSSLPEGPDEPGWLSPPIWPCTTRGLPCRPDCSDRGGLLPHRFTLTKRDHPAIRLRGLLSGCLKVFLQMATEAHCTGGLFSVALSVAVNLASLARIARRVDPLALPGALPFSLRRYTPKALVLALHAKTFVPRRKTRRPRCPDFPPGLPSCEGWPSDHPACPPRSVYHLAAIACAADAEEIKDREVGRRGHSALPALQTSWAT